ncbi:MAG: MFS transporter [Gammaproteobacteria bacterium]|nr:MFS transporter [Gammaproteobacteria bacterium]
MPRRIGQWYYGWTVVGVAMLFKAVVFGVTFYSFTLYANEWLADPEIEVSTATVMLGSSLVILMSGFISPLLGRALDHVSMRLFICLGAIMTALGMALVAHATAFWQILVIYACVLPFGIVLSGPLAAQTLAVKWFDGRRGTAMGIVTTGTSIGGFCVPILVAYLFAETDWRTGHLVLAACILLLILPPVWLLVQNSPRDKGIDPDPPASTPTEVSENSSATPRLWTTRTILGEPNFWVICGVMLLLGAGISGISLHISPFATDLGIPKIQHGFFISLYAGIMIPSKIVFGHLSDRIDVRYLLWGGATCLGLCAALLAVTSSFIMLAVSCVFLGVASGSMLPLMGSLISSRFGAHAFGRVMGMLGPFNACAGFASVAIGAARDASGGYDAGWMLVLFTTVPIAVLTTFLDRIGRSRSHLRGGAVNRPS